MPEVSLDQPIVLDLLDTKSPALSATSDMPVIETKPDATPAKEAVPAPTEEVEAPAAADEAKTDEQSADIKQPESTSASDDADPKKPAKGVQKRLDELVAQREEAKRQVEAERAEKLRLMAMLEARDTPKKAEPDVTEPVKPRREDYADPEHYTEAFVNYAAEFATWKVTREFEAKQRVEHEARQQASIVEQQEAVRKTYAGRVEKFKEEHADYTAVAESPDVKISIPMAHAITASDNGPQLAYHLGKNPAEADRIASLPPAMQLMELGKLEAKLTAKPVIPVSAAPAPIKPITPAKGSTDTPLEELSMEAYAAARKKQQADARRH